MIDLLERAASTLDGCLSRLHLARLLNFWLQALDKLHSWKEKWLKVSCFERSMLLRECLQRANVLAQGMAEVTGQAKGSYGSGIGEEYMNILPLMFGLKEYIKAMDANGQPQPRRITQRPNGQHVAKVRGQGPNLAPNIV